MLAYVIRSWKNREILRETTLPKMQECYRSHVFSNNFQAEREVNRPKRLDENLVLSSLRLWLRPNRRGSYANRGRYDSQAVIDGYE